MGNKNWDNDYYTKKAKAENYNARSVYKLIEIDKKLSLFNKKKYICTRPWMRTRIMAPICC